MDIYGFIEQFKIRENFTIVECGGHMGQDTIKISKLLEKCYIHTIQANLDIFSTYLKDLPKTQSNISVYNHGLSDCNETKGTFHTLNYTCM